MKAIFYLAFFLILFAAGRSFGDGEPDVITNADMQGVVVTNNNFAAIYQQVSNLQAAVGIGTTITGSNMLNSNNKDVLYNKNGVIGGSDNFVFDGTNVGIGNKSPGAALDVEGTLSLALFGGNVGIGTTFNNARLNVGANESIGSTYAGFAPPSNGLIVQGNVGIGTNVPKSSLAVNGGITVGFLTDRVNPNVGIIAPGADILGNLKSGVGIGTWTPSNQYAMDIEANGISPQGIRGIIINSEHTALNITESGSSDDAITVNGGLGAIAVNAKTLGNNVAVYGTAPASSSGIGVVGQTLSSSNSSIALEAIVPANADSTVTALNVQSLSNTGNNYDIKAQGANTLNFIQGNLGVGSLIPGAILDVQGTLRILGKGNIGIGTSYPGQSLDVNGTARASAFAVIDSGNVGISTTLTNPTTVKIEHGIITIWN